jgi:hypothetical protein
MATRFRVLLKIAFPAFALAGLSSCIQELQIPTYLGTNTSFYTLQAGQPTTATLEAQVLDANRTPMAGVTVFFSVEEGTATLDAMSSVTDNTGTAKINALASTKSGNVRIEASVPGIAVPVSFTLQVGAGPPSTIKIVSGDQQEGAKNTSVPNALVVLVTDAFDNPTAMTPLTFVVTSGNGEMTATSTVTAPDGKASTMFKLGSEPVNKIKVSFQVDKSVEFNLYSLLPVNLHTPVAGTQSIDLAWSANVNPTFASYLVFRSISNTGQFVPVAAITDAETTAFTDTQIKQGELYTYKVTVATAKGKEVESNTQLAEVSGYFDLSSWVQDVTMSPDGTMLYITDDITQKIQFLSTSTLTTVDNIQTDYNPFHVAVNAEHSRLYVTDRWTGTLYVYSLPGKALITTVNVSAACGTTSIADVYKTTNGQLFVSANEGFVAKIDESNGYTATRVASGLYYLGRPSFVGDYGGFLYMEESLMSPNSLFKLDLSLPDVPKVLEDQHGKVNGTRGAILDPSLNRIYTTFGQVLSTTDFSTEGALNDAYTAMQVAPGSNRLYATFDKDFPPDKYKLLSFDRTTFAAGPVIQLGYAASTILISPDENTAYLVSIGDSRKRIYKLELPE